MGSISALLFASSILGATPLFGLALSAPDAALAPSAVRVEPVWEASLEGAVPALDVALTLETRFGIADAVKVGAKAKARASGAGAAAKAEATDEAEPAEEGAAAEEEESEEESDTYAEDVRARAELTKIHRPLGIATYAAMGLTLVLGGIQYYNLYGIFAGRDSNPCVEGNAVFGQGQCSGTPWLHRGAAFLTAGLYTGTFVVASLMPDPDDASEGDSEFAETLRMHKLLRWVHLGGMIAQMGLGLFVANTGSLDRANDYGTLQALGTVHLGLGLVTFGAMTWAMLLML